MIDEKLYYGKKTIKYLFKKIEGSKKLIVIFSGYSTNPKVRSPYNYMETLSNSDINQLYIADSYGFDERGCWYIGENGSFDVEESVIGLINSISERLEISKLNIVLAGSSKGGFASLYYGLKYGFSKVICGAPQVFLIKYLSTPNHIKILKSIVKNNDDRTLDSLILNNKITNLTSIYILCGIHDHHLKGHIIPFIKHNDYHSNIKLRLFNGYHNDIGNIFKMWLQEIIEKIINGEKNISWDTEISKQLKSNLDINLVKGYINSNIISTYIDKNKLKTKMEILNVNYSYACYLFKDEKLIKRRFYRPKPYFEFEVEDKGQYELKWYIKDGNDTIISIMDSSINNYN